MVTSKDSQKKAAAASGKPAPARKPKRKAAPAKPKPKKARAPKAPESRYIGIDVKPPLETCSDKACPFHGTLPVRGQILKGEVVSQSMQSTVVVKKVYMRELRKYERLEKRVSRYLVHSPPCLGVGKGDRVKIMECRPLSKQVSFVIIEKTEQE